MRFVRGFLVCEADWHHCLDVLRAATTRLGSRPHISTNELEVAAYVTRSHGKTSLRSALTAVAHQNFAGDAKEETRIDLQILQGSAGNCNLVWQVSESARAPSRVLETHENLLYGTAVFCQR